MDDKALYKCRVVLVYGSVLKEGGGISCRTECHIYW
jgi:hypothetical protein